MSAPDPPQPGSARWRRPVAAPVAAAPGGSARWPRRPVAPAPGGSGARWRRPVAAAPGGSGARWQRRPVAAAPGGSGAREPVPERVLISLTSDGSLTCAGPGSPPHLAFVPRRPTGEAE
ncbi:unnamed protein product [Pleuronectes platessa]|uniref:Uncharacterized protein n=1 Tax=Pleuronectes platessa TaxID=8262 RepID=A0A9N7VRK4_PLEPL|nr:unnamed protein product [Pleuronectes platessa]